MRREIKSVCYLLGGDKLSGAEKRIIITAAEMSKDSVFKIKLITTEELKLEFLKSELASIDTSRVKWVVRTRNKSKNKHFRRFVNVLSGIWLNLVQLPRFNSYVHVVLYSNAVLISIVMARLLGNSKYYYEITSPDVAKSNATKNLIKYGFLSDRLVCVSESVRKALGKSVSNVYTRKQPLAYLGKQERSINKENIVVYAHRLIERKNPMLAVEVFKRLSKEFSNWDFYLCGDGELREEIEAAVISANCPNFKYKGYIYDMDDLMKRSKIFLSLIEPDNYPSQSVFNAMANGNALIISDTGSSKSMFIQGNGYAVELDLIDIEDKIKKIINIDNIDELSERSFNLFATKYCQGLYFEECKNIYS